MREERSHGEQHPRNYVRARVCVKKDRMESSTPEILKIAVPDLNGDRVTDPGIPVRYPLALSR